MSFELCHHLSFCFLSQFKLSFVAIWHLKFWLQLSCWALSQFEFWVLSRFEFLSFVITWVFEFSHNLGLVTIWVFELSHFQFEFCHHLSFWVDTVWVFDLSQFGFLVVTIKVFFSCHNLSSWVLSQFEFEFFLWKKDFGVHFFCERCFLENFLFMFFFCEIFVFLLKKKIGW